VLVSADIFHSVIYLCDTKRNRITLTTRRVKTWRVNSAWRSIWAVKRGRESRRLNFPLLRVKREPRFYFLNTRVFMNMRKFIEAYPRPTFQPNNGPV